MRYLASEKLEIIRLVEQSHLPARRTLEKLGVARATFYRWCDVYQTGGPEALENRSSRPERVWNRIPDGVRGQVVQLVVVFFAIILVERAHLRFDGRQIALQRGQSLSGARSVRPDALRLGMAALATCNAVPSENVPAPIGPPTAKPANPAAATDPARPKGPSWLEASASFPATNPHYKYHWPKGRSTGRLEPPERHDRPRSMRAR